MANDKPIHILARLEIGFRTDSAQLKELEEDLAVTLLRARQFTGKQGSPHDWNEKWQRQWNHFEETLQRMRALVNVMAEASESTDSARLKMAWETWVSIQKEDTLLAEALSNLRTQARELDATVRKDWDVLVTKVESHVETIRVYTQALRIKLELLKRHSKDEVDRLVQDILAKLPVGAYADGMSAESIEQEYRKAASELEHEHHKFLGFSDVVKGMLMWVETPKERVHKKQSEKVDAA